VRSRCLTQTTAGMTNRGGNPGQANGVGSCDFTTSLSGLAVFVPVYPRLTAKNSTKRKREWLITLLRIEDYTYGRHHHNHLRDESRQQRQKKIAALFAVIIMPRWRKAPPCQAGSPLLARAHSRSVPWAELGLQLSCLEGPEL